MTTPVDIDKLKELLSKARGDGLPVNYWTTGKGLTAKLTAQRDLEQAAVIALPALIAKAERVDALEHALKITREALCEHACHAGIEVPCIRTRDQCQSECGKSAGDAIVAVDKILCPGAAARNALSPKESE